MTSFSQTFLFQSTHPSWGATILFNAPSLAPLDFNPRTHRGVRPEQVSSSHYQVLNFNPRTHRGVRLHAIIYDLQHENFNPRTHRGVRPKARRQIIIRRIFQSTHPSWGATFSQSAMGYTISDFNPRTHRGVRRYVSQLLRVLNGWISIHAPIVGCDIDL